ncbi:MAG TPA: NUDIX domain-containing protein [Candidatus Saccharimonadales bacterium]|nr:NUDIX domain-containing protein [Candidatus Saccharimonadales bacterium]
MPHIHTRPGQHDSTVSMFIVRTDQAEPKMMFHLHKKHQVYMQFGGHIELDENPWQAVVRELLEETGYDINQLEILQPKPAIKKLTGITTHPLPIAYTTHRAGPGHFHSDAAFAFVSNQQPKHELVKTESSQVRLLNRDELAKIPAAQTYENGREIALFILDKGLEYWHRLPATSW